MEQLQLFTEVRHDGHIDYVPNIVRHDDKQTSYSGAKHIAPKLAGLRMQFIESLRSRGGPSTANEVAQGKESLRKRYKELLDEGLIHEMGLKRCSVSGSMATAYWLSSSVAGKGKA